MTDHAAKLAEALDAVMRDYELCGANGELGLIWKSNVSRAKKALRAHRRASLQSEVSSEGETNR